MDGKALLRFLHALLACDRFARPLAGAGISAGSLASHREIPAMAKSTIAGDFFEPSDILLLLPSQLACDNILAVEDDRDACDLFFIQLFRLPLRIDLGFVTHCHPTFPDNTSKLETGRVVAHLIKVPPFSTVGRGLQISMLSKYSHVEILKSGGR